MREINDHRVYGESVFVMASSEKEAREHVRLLTSKHIWEIYRTHPKNARSLPDEWEAYVANHEDCFALND